MKTIVINNQFKKITIAYEIKNRLTKDQVTSEIQDAIGMATDYRDYCYLLKTQQKLMYLSDSSIEVSEFWSKLK